jgi:hypothetical protein
MKSDFLYRLIHSLDVGEVRECEHHLATAKGSLAQPRKLLFDTLLRQKRVSQIENLHSHIHEHEIKAWCKVFLITEAELFKKRIGRLTDRMLERIRG